MGRDGADGDRRAGPAAAPGSVARGPASRHALRSPAPDADGRHLHRPPAVLARPAAPLRSGASPPLPPSRPDPAALSPAGGRAAPRGLLPDPAPAQRGPAPDGRRYRLRANPPAADGPARAAGGAGGGGLSGPGGGGRGGQEPPGGVQPGADTASRPRAQRRARPHQPAVDPRSRQTVPPAAGPHRPAPPAGLPGGGRCRPAADLRKDQE